MDREARNESCEPLFIGVCGRMQGVERATFRSRNACGLIFPGAARTTFRECFCRVQGCTASRELQQVLAIAKARNCASFIETVLPQVCKVF